MKALEFNFQIKMNIFKEYCSVYKVEFDQDNLDLFTNLCELKINQNIEEIFIGIYWITG